MRERDIFSPMSYGPFYRVGPYTRFLRRLFTIAASLGAIGVSMQTMESISARISHVGPAFLELCLVTLAFTVLSGLSAATAFVGEYFNPSGHRLHSPQALDIASRVFGIGAITTYIAVGIYALATIEPFTRERLALFSNQHPLQSHSLAFVVLTIAIFSQRWRMVFLLTTTFVMAFLPVIESGSPPRPEAFDGPIGTLCFNLAILGGGSWLLQQAISLDAAHEAVNNEQMGVRTQQAINKAHRRMNNFIHDHILSVLISVAAGLTNRRTLRISALNTLAALNNRTEKHDIHSSSRLITLIDEMVRRLDSNVEFLSNDTETMALPAGVGSAMFDATHEALTNSLRHAATSTRPNPSRRVTLTVSFSGIQIEIYDDGAGFDPTDLELARLGIKYSILSHMEIVEGHASYESFPDQGTRVVLFHSLEPSRATPEENVSLLAPMTIENLLEQRPGRAIVAYAVFAHLYQLLVHWNEYRNPWISAFAMLLLAAMSALLSRRWPQSLLPTWAACLVAVVGPLANFAVLVQIEPHGWPENESWPFGFVGMLCWGLVLRGCSIIAWGSMSLLVVSTMPWVLGNHQPWTLIITLTIGHIISLALWTAITSLARWASIAIFKQQRQRMELEAERIESEQAAAVVESMLDRVDKQVRPILQLVADGEPITPEIRQQAALLEAELRDEIRGGARLTSLIKNSVRKARERGVAVILMDDRGDDELPGQAKQMLRTQATAILQSTNTDRVVIRLAPAGRKTFATINTSDEMVSINEDGAVASDEN